MKHGRANLIERFYRQPRVVAIEAAGKVSEGSCLSGRGELIELHALATCGPRSLMAGCPPFFFILPRNRPMPPTPRDPEPTDTFPLDPTRRQVLQVLGALGVGSAVFQRALAAQAQQAATVTPEM